jgi:spore coat polysaccharide biosynthesis protein SpsF
MSKGRFKSDQENFWAGEFGDIYADRNDGAGAYVEATARFFESIFSRASAPGSVIEFGANIGLNIQALHRLLPRAELAAIEINEKAVHKLKALPQLEVFPTSILDFVPARTWDLALIKGVLIHINPDALPAVYSLLHRSSSRYVCVIEYYNPTPVEVPYRGHQGRLFKRDFAGEMLDAFPDLRLVDYGFTYRRDTRYREDDTTWFLMEKT